MFLDEVVFEKKRFLFVVRHDYLNTVNPLDEVFCLYLFLPLLCVTFDPLLQIPRFSHIDDGILVVPEEIDTGLFGKTAHNRLVEENLAPCPVRNGYHIALSMKRFSSSATARAISSHAPISIRSSLRRRSRNCAAFSKSHRFAASPISFFSFFIIFESFFGSTTFPSMSSRGTER